METAPPTTTLHISREWRLRAFMGLAFSLVFIGIAIFLVAVHVATILLGLLIVAALVYFDYPYVRLALHAGDIQLDSATVRVKPLLGNMRQVDLTQIQRVDLIKIFSGKRRPLYAFRLQDAQGKSVYLAANALTKSDRQIFGHELFMHIARQYLLKPSVSWDARSVEYLTASRPHVAAYMSGAVFQPEDIALFQAYFRTQPR